MPNESMDAAGYQWRSAVGAPEWIARQMGYATTEMLFKVYSRYVPNLTRQDGSAFERLLAQRGVGQVLEHTPAGHGSNQAEAA